MRERKRQKAWKAYMIHRQEGFFHKACETVKTLFFQRHLFICAACHVSGIKLNWKTVGESTFSWHTSTSADPLSVVYTQTTHRQFSLQGLHGQCAGDLFLFKKKKISKRLYSGIHKEFMEVNCAVRQGDFKNPCCVHTGWYYAQYM